MKTLDEIQRELDRREAPSELSAITIYAKELQKAGEGAASRISMLVATAKRTIFKDESGFHKWAKDTLYFSPNHTSHCAKIGAILLDAKVESFEKLVRLPFNKLLALSRLELSAIESLLDAKDITAMSREQLRVAVKETLGEPTSKGDSRVKETEEDKAMAAIKLIAALDMETLSQLVRKADIEVAKAMLKAGQNMLAASIDIAISQGDAAGRAILATAERVLSIQSNDAKRRLEEMKAVKPQLEEKTA